MTDAEQLAALGIAEFEKAWQEFLNDPDVMGYEYYEAKPHKAFGDLPDLARTFFLHGFVSGALMARKTD